MSELLPCISKRVSYVLSSKFPGVTQVVNAVLRLMGEEPRNIVETNPLLYIEILDQLSDLTLILSVSFHNDDWIYEFLNSLRNRIDIIAILAKNRAKIMKYCSSSSADIISKENCPANEVLLENINY